ncbi:Rho-GTPase-activating protein [Nesidiocoris tenuis]|uniref:Rho-GTPase-activating protein n=1 Tax=Nesidiocoris tenuis TaxID=355587 RepID=A0ABN7B691_9HEMI|nr:Rho-GTPase-activating protein [Nesidiocoris tenuis]
MCDKDSSGCFFSKKTGRETTPDLATSPRRLPNQKQPPPMVIQPDFRKVSGISSEMFRQIESIENECDSAAAGAGGGRGEMVVRLLDPKSLGTAAAVAARPWLNLQASESKGHVRLVEIVKRPGQTLGLYIREGNGIDRSDGVFISRIALESSVYNSGCLKVGDEILAVNMVDVTRMSLDDVVIIMSIPRRLILVTREGSPCPIGVTSQPHHKPLPVVVMKGQIGSRDASPSPCKLDEDRPPSRLAASRSHLALGLSGSGSRADLHSSHDLHGSHDMHGHEDHRNAGLAGQNKRMANGGYYHTTPASSHHLSHSHTSHTMERGSWLYQPPPPPVVTEQPKSHHYTPSYDKPSHPGTLESLAEKVSPSVHSFYPGGSSTTPRRMSATTSSGLLSYYGSSSRSKVMPRSGSDQHLPRVEYMDYNSSREPPAYRSSYRSTGPTPSATYSSTLSRRQRSVDYSSDTEASRPSYYYYRQHSSGTSGIGTGLTSLDHSATSRLSSLRSNSLPRDTRQPRSHIPTLPTHRGSTLRLERDSLLSSSGLEDDDGALSAPEMSLNRKTRADEYRAWLSRAPSSSAIYQSVSRGAGGSLLASQKASQRFAFSSENLPQRTRQSELLYSTYRPGQLAAMGPLVSSSSTTGPIKSTTLDRVSLLDRSHSTLDRSHSTLDRTLDRSHSTLDRALDRSHSTLDRALDRSHSTLDRSHSTLDRTHSTLDRGFSDHRVSTLDRVSSTLDRHHSSALTSRSASLRRMHNLLELEAKSLGKGSLPSPLSGSDLASAINKPASSRHSTSSLLHINPAEFLKYKQSVGRTGQADVSGLLWLHLLSGRGLRASTNPSGSTSNLGAGGNSVVRDLYCVLECDGVHKARTVVRTADLVFDWDETFELDLVSNRELDFLIYSWDPQYRHKLCYKGSVQLASLLSESPVHQLAVKIEPRGTLYMRLHHTTPQQTFSRKPKQSIVSRGKTQGIFGTDLETVVNRESIASEILKGDALNIPTIVRRCVEEVERRGLDIIGLYRLCGSATKKRILREAFERSPRTVDLSSDNVPDINVITGVLKDYMRELPEPLVTKCLYQMLADAVSVCLPDDPQGNASLIFSILDCLPHVNRCTFIYLMNHLALVASQQDRNKMSTQALATCFAPVLVLHSETAGQSLDFHGPISVIKYLLDIWPSATERAPCLPPRPGCAAPAPPPLPAKPKPQVVTSPVTPPSSSDDEYAKSAFDSKANFDSKKSVFERPSQANHHNGLANGGQEHRPLPSSMGVSPTVGQTGPLPASVGQTGPLQTTVGQTSPLQAAMETNGGIFDTESIVGAIVQQGTPSGNHQQPTIVTSSGPTSPPKYTLKVNRNNPFAEDMEAVTPTSGSEVTDGGGGGPGGHDADGENSDDSAQLNDDLK